MLTSRFSDQLEVSPFVDALILAGDEPNLKLATRAIVRHGPARAIRKAISGLDFLNVTRTTARPALTLLAEGGDVADPHDADRHANWILDTLIEPVAWAEQFASEFILSNALRGALRGLSWAVGPATTCRIVDAILDLPACSDQLEAHDWGGLVASLPASARNPEDTRRAADRSADHNFELQYSLVEIAAQHHPDVRERLLAEAATGNVQAVAALGEVRNITEPTVSALVRIAVDQVANERQMASEGGYAVGSVNWGWLLAALNILHPSAADWQSLLELLRDPAVFAAQTAPAVRVPAQLAHEIPEDVLPELISTINAHLDPARGASPFRAEDLEAAASSFLLNVDEVYRDSQGLVLYQLLTGSDADRHAAAVIVGQ